MYMTNVKVLIKPDETAQDVIAEICNDCGLQTNEHFAFSAIMVPSKEEPNCYDLKINCLDEHNKNPYTPETLITNLWSKPISAQGVRYVQPPIQQWVELFKPLLLTLIDEVHPRYEKLIPERDEMLSILYYAIAKLHNKGYYLHKNLVKRAFVNELNMECRTLKNNMITDSLDEPVGRDEEGKEITLLDQIADPEATEWARRCNSYTEDDYWEDLYERVKKAMLEEMSEFQFNRILVQLKTHTIDRKTSYWLKKYRDIFNPGYVPRPNAKGKPKGGKKK